MSEEEYKYVSCDPGSSIYKATTGMTCWSSTGKALEMDQYTRIELVEFLKVLNTKGVKVIIIEEYRIAPNVNHNWSEVQTIETIGILIGWAIGNSIEIVKIKPAVKKIAEMWSGQKSPKRHDISHGPDSYLIGYYYLHKIGIIKPRVLKEYGRDKDNGNKGDSKADNG